MTAVQRGPTAVSVRVERIDDLLPRVSMPVGCWLSTSEFARYAGLANERRRRQYLAGHWLVREVLSDAEGGAPRDWPLRERAGQPPHVQPDPSLSVSLSHSGDWIAAACARAPIGIDIEQRNLPRSLGRFGHLLRADDDAPGGLDDDALLQRWVVKEAWIKRDCGSALPRQLAALRLRRAEERVANVHLLVDPDVLLGIAVDGDVSLRVAMASVPGTCARWRVDGEVRQRSARGD